MKVLDKKEITIAEAGQYYSRVAVTTNYEDAIVQEYLNKFSKLPAEKARELVSELVSKGVSVATAVSIANCLPSSRDELLPFLAHEQAISPLEKLGELFSVVEKYLPDKQVPVKGRYEGDGD